MWAEIGNQFGRANRGKKNVIVCHHEFQGFGEFASVGFLKPLRVREKHSSGFDKSAGLLITSASSRGFTPDVVVAAFLRHKICNQFSILRCWC